MKRIALLGLFGLLFSLALLPSDSARADEYTSGSFKVLDPVMNPAGYSTAAGYQLWGTVAQTALGIGSSASFGTNPGFLTYPLITTPVVSTTAGDAQVALSWVAVQGFLGWTPSSYLVGQATVSGGPYSYTNVGNVVSSTRTGLSNSTPYYFVIVVADAFGNNLATSTEVSATPVSAGGGGGGGGGGDDDDDTRAIFSGRAYPLSKVTLLKDAQVVASTVAGPNAIFEIIAGNLSAGTYIFSVYSEDKQGNRSALQTFPATLTVGATIRVSGIFIAPTIAVDKSEVKRGDNISIFGQSTPQSNIVISVNSEEEFFVNTKSDTIGAYLLNFDTSVLEMGQHNTRSKAALLGEISSYSKTVGFAVGTKNVLVTQGKCPTKADLNDDCRVNLVDFSIAAYWYKRPVSAAFAEKERSKLSGDGNITLTDFSIMAYHWTG